MSGIFYDPHRRRLHRVDGTPQPGWRLVTHDVAAGPNQCRRIMREWLPAEELLNLDWSGATGSA